MEYPGKQYDFAGYTGQQAYAGHYYQQPSQAIQYQYLGEQPRYGSAPYTISKATDTIAIAHSKATDASARFSKVTDTSTRSRRGTHYHVYLSRDAIMITPFPFAFPLFKRPARTASF
jgi:hypothetical protein